LIFKRKRTRFFLLYVERPQVVQIGGTGVIEQKAKGVLLLADAGCAQLQPWGLLYNKEKSMGS
jgi:hypothetical protein